VSGGPFTYDGAAHAASAVALGVFGAPVSGTFAFTYTPPGDRTVPVTAGTYTVSAHFSSSDPNYTGAAGCGSIVINKATPTISWATPADITYGIALGPSQLDAIATSNGKSVTGTFVYTPAAGTILKAGSGQLLSVSFTLTDTTDFTDASASTTINVLMAATSLLLSDASGSFGSTTTLSAVMSSVTSLCTVGQSVGFLLNGGSVGSATTDTTTTATLSNVALGGLKVGSYPISASYARTANCMPSDPASAQVNISQARPLPA
jgi:hypothetical protein